MNDKFFADVEARVKAKSRDVTIKARTSTKHIVKIEGHEERAIGVRVYGESPDRSALQIRTFGPTVPGGVKKAMYSHASLTLKDIEDLIIELEVQRARLVSHL